MKPFTFTIIEKLSTGKHKKDEPKQSSQMHLKVCSIQSHFIHWICVQKLKPMQHSLKITQIIDMMIESNRP